MGIMEKENSPPTHAVNRDCPVRQGGCNSHGRLQYSQELFSLVDATDDQSGGVDMSIVNWLPVPIRCTTPPNKGTAFYPTEHSLYSFL